MANPNPPTAHLKRDAGPGRPKGSKNKLTRERLETEIRRLALMDPLALFERSQGKRRTFTLREIASMDVDTRACIASVKVRTENLKAGDDAQDQTVEIRLWDKTRALELAARTLGMLKDKLEITAPEEHLAMLDRCKIRARQQGQE